MIAWWASRVPQCQKIKNIYLESPLPSVLGPFAMTLLFRCIQFLFGYVDPKKGLSKKALDYWVLHHPINRINMWNTTCFVRSFWKVCWICLLPYRRHSHKWLLSLTVRLPFFMPGASAVQDLSFAFFAFVPTGSQSFPFGATCHSPILTIQYKPDFDPISLQCSLSNGSCMDSSA